MPATVAAAAAPSFGAQLGQSVGLGAGMSTGSGLLGQLFGGLNARRQWKYMKKQMNLQQQYALEQMQKQYEYQKSMFDYENAYNDPSKVMERYRAAGVNPSAVLGSSGASMSATMPVGAGPSGSSISPGQPIGAGTSPNLSADALTASQIRLNNANAENAQSSADLSSEKAITESSVRNVLAATVDEKQQNAYFTEQRAIYQGLVNAKTPDMIDSQISQLRAHADQLIASAKLSQEQVDLVKEQTAATVVDAELKRAMRDTQTELGKLYHSEAGFVSLQAEDLGYNIQSLINSHTFTTYTMGKNGKAVPVNYTIDGYSAKTLAVQFGAMEGASRAAIAGIRADWENPNQWNSNINSYWNSVNGSINAVGDLIMNAKRLPILQQSVNQAGQGTTSVTQTYGPDGRQRGMIRTTRIPHR